MFVVELISCQDEPFLHIGKLLLDVRAESVELVIEVRFQDILNACM